MFSNKIYSIKVLWITGKRRKRKWREKNQRNFLQFLGSSIQQEFDIKKKIKFKKRYSMEAMKNLFSTLGENDERQKDPKNIFYSKIFPISNINFVFNFLNSFVYSLLIILDKSSIMQNTLHKLLSTIHHARETQQARLNHIFICCIPHYDGEYFYWMITTKILSHRTTFNS